MKNTKLKKYLNTFRDESDVSVIIVDPVGRKQYPVTGYAGITDMGQPVFVLEVGQPNDMDTGNIEHTDLTDQMSIYDIPGVMP